MSLFSSLFKKKQESRQLVERDQIGEEISRPEPISAKMSDFFSQLPSWIGDEKRWGYSKDDAFIMARDNHMGGIRSEYGFAEFRSKVEVREKLKMVYEGMERYKQRLVDDGPNHFDVLSIKVYLFTNEDWEFLKNDYESHNSYKDDEEGRKRHTQLRNERIKYYMTECWFNINSFYKE
ncbi:MAG: hypothetical protein IKP91_05940 [Bacteroidaceae bacterium]|nr:hypothetical protein [Bacteroidaceae bacterium]